MGAVAAGASLTGRSPAAAAVPPVDLGGGLQVRPREAWATQAAPGALEQEDPADVLFLLVHHTASSNDYGPEDVADHLRGFFTFHTGADRGFPDIAYNFLVDRFGTVWEGRTGSVSGPVKPSATGGSQGFAMLGCYIGDHTTEPPTPEARASMLRLLAWLADSYGVDTNPGATVSFESRGSNRWAAGETVTTATIAGHRDMSLTACPGDAAYGDVRANYAAEVTALRTAAGTTATSPAATTTPPATTPPATVSASVSASATATATVSSPPSPDASAPAAVSEASEEGDGGVEPWLVLGTVAAATVATGAAIARHSANTKRDGAAGSGPAAN